LYEPKKQEEKRASVCLSCNQRCLPYPRTISSTGPFY